jgi:hypothetical protein
MLFDNTPNAAKKAGSESVGDFVGTVVQKCGYSVSFVSNAHPRNRQKNMSLYQS